RYIQCRVQGSYNPYTPFWYSQILLPQPRSVKFDKKHILWHHQERPESEYPRKVLLPLPSSFFFKQKPAYELGLGIPAEPLFRSQTYKHSVPRFFVPEHGTMFTLALVRFPPTATKEIQYLNAKGALTYTDIAGDPVLYGNLP